MTELPGIILCVTWAAQKVVGEPAAEKIEARVEVERVSDLFQLISRARAYWSSSEWVETYNWGRREAAIKAAVQAFRAMLEEVIP